MNILVLNCGSSSIKYQLLRINNDNKLIVKGQVDRIGISGSEIEQKKKGKEPILLETKIKNHKEGIDLILKFLIDARHGAIQSISEIEAVGHRVVHGGEKFTKSVIINESVKNEIRNCFDLAPLHNPANLTGIEVLEKLLPQIPQVAVFDTAFHQTMPEEAYLYGIPYEYYTKHNVRRFGFHGTSHEFVANKACKLLDWDIKTKKIITCHLGNGASITAIDGGKSVNTSMGLTPNDGLLMGTRSGVIDPGIFQYLSVKENLTVDEINSILNKKSGMIGLSEQSSDMRDLATAMRSGNKDATRALKTYALRVKQYIGGYAANMNGLDLIILTGGIGENNYSVRKLVLEDLEFIGAALDVDINHEMRGEDKVISKTNSRTKIMVIQTNEELVIAMDTFSLCK